MKEDERTTEGLTEDELVAHVMLRHRWEERD